MLYITFTIIMEGLSSVPTTKIINYQTSSGEGRIEVTAYSEGFFRKTLIITPVNQKKSKKLEKIFDILGVPYDSFFSGNNGDKINYMVPISFLNAYWDVGEKVIFPQIPAKNSIIEDIISSPHSTPSLRQTNMMSSLEESPFISPFLYQKRAESPVKKRGRQQKITTKEPKASKGIKLSDSERYIRHVLNKLNGWGLVEKAINGNGNELVVKVPTNSHHDRLYLLDGNIDRGLNRLRIQMGLECGEDLTYTTGKELRITNSGQKLIKLGAKKYNILP